MADFLWPIESLTRPVANLGLLYLRVRRYNFWERNQKWCNIVEIMEKIDVPNGSKTNHKVENVTYVI